MNINTVIEILQRKAQGDSWKEAFLGSIPKRLLRCDKTGIDPKDMQENILIENEQEISGNQDMIVEGLEDCENTAGEFKDVHEGAVIVEVQDAICNQDTTSKELLNCESFVDDPKDVKEAVVIEIALGIIDNQDKNHDQ